MRATGLERSAVLWQTVILAAGGVCIFPTLADAILLRWLPDPVLRFVFQDPSISLSAQAIAYRVCAMLLCAALGYAASRRFGSSLATDPARPLINAVAAFAAFCLVECLFVHRFPPPAYYLSWLFVTYSLYFGVVSIFTRERAIRTCELLAVMITLQSGYAVATYLGHGHQFHTPGFGDRAMGMYRTPNTLYPLCLLGLTFAYGLGQSPGQSGRNALWHSFAVINLAALALTFTRAGWIGAAVAALYFVWIAARQGAWRASGVTALIVACALLCATLFVRTGGHWIGNRADRSFWGRVEIWRVGCDIVRRHPLLGVGIGEYGPEQNLAMTPALARLDPLNEEAKSLYLNVAVECGLIGLGLLALIVVAYVRCGAWYLAQRREPPGPLLGLHAGILSILVAGLFDTPILQEGRLPSTFCFFIWLAAIAVSYRGRNPEGLSVDEKDANVPRHNA